MTKAEFKTQFDRLRLAGYRLQLPEGAAIQAVLAEWYPTFAECYVEDLAVAIDRVKQTKTDTFWPAIGEVYQHILDVRKERARRNSERDYDYPEVPEAERQAGLAYLKEAMKAIQQKHRMPDSPGSGLRLVKGA